MSTAIVQGRLCRLGFYFDVVVAVELVVPLLLPLVFRLAPGLTVSHRPAVEVPSCHLGVALAFSKS